MVPHFYKAMAVTHTFMVRPFSAMTGFFLFTFFTQLLGQNSNANQIDTFAYSQQTITIQGKKYHGSLTGAGFQLLDSKTKVYLKHSGDYFTWAFKDFDKDGYKDIFLDKGGNTPERFDLLLYVRASKTFKQVKNFEYFPAPENISGTKYFYSYHKSGCADLNWDSDLFYIKDFKAIRIANISGRECGNTGIKDGLYIYKIRSEKKVLFRTLSIDTVHTFKDGKWGFIQNYWTRNCKLFL